MNRSPSRYEPDCNSCRSCSTTAGTLGHGFHMMLRTADRVFLLTGPGGTTLVLEKEREAPGPPLPPELTA